ncbi:unnamed protein product [Euphydryas editha]|uniref:Uncharacterized protein n=1 Tax=Euphydryas editha TaxID=104508 RepID=A0AAU9UUU3_EUPED|nr:unnamed protein product [Euphydryas editha]
MKFLMKQYTANRVASLSPSSGLILGSATGGKAASAGGPRTSGVAALMAAPRGRVPDACGAILTQSQHHAKPPRITPPPAPAALPARGCTVAGAGARHPLLSCVHTTRAELRTVLSPTAVSIDRGVAPALRWLTATLASHVQHEKR